MGSTCRDRTSEFRSLSQTLRKIGGGGGSQAVGPLGAGVAPPTTSQPVGFARSEFNKKASRIGLGIHEASQKIARLTKLEKKSSIFDDPTIEIPQLTALIKDDITAMKTALQDLQTLQNLEMSDGRYSEDKAVHYTTVCDDLKSRLLVTTKQLQDVLTTRTQNKGAGMDAASNKRVSVGVAWAASPVSSTRKRRAFADVNSRQDAVEELDGVIAELRNENLALREQLAKESSEKLEAINCHLREKEGRIAAEKLKATLLEDLEKCKHEILAAHHKIASLEDLYKKLIEYNTSVRQYNSKLQTYLSDSNEDLKRVENEKLSIVENLDALRRDYTALQEQLASCQTLGDEAIKQKELFAAEVKCLREELQQVREDRDNERAQVQAISADVLKYEEKIQMANRLEELDGVIAGLGNDDMFLREQLAKESSEKPESSVVDITDAKSLAQEYLRFINGASKEKLKALKGIGEKRASLIIELREISQEPFKQLDDLKTIGLSSKQIKKLLGN